MFAITLANQLGFVDVDAMLDQMTPEQFDERYAHHRLSLDNWQIGAMIAAEVSNAATRMILARGGKPAQPGELLEPRLLVPWPRWMRDEQKDNRYLTDEQAEAELRGLA